MKVYSQLEYAQLHNVAADPVVGVTGRVAVNTVSNEAVYDDGVAIRTVANLNKSQTFTNKKFDDPMLVKQTASAGTPASGYNNLYPKSDNLWYSKNSSGVEVPVGSGGGEYNFISTKQATDWVGYDDGAAAFPVDGTGSSATGCTLVAATSPISNEPGVINIKMTKDGSNRQGKGFGLAFSTRGDIDKAAVRVCKINVATTANYVDGDVIVMLYDTTNGQLIYPSDQRIFASTLVSAQQFEFQLSADSTSYRLILHVASTNASAYDLNAVVKFVETKKQTGVVMTDWQAYTPTPSNNTSITTNVAKWRRIGSDVEIMGRIVWGGAGAGSSFSLTLPTGISADLTRLPSERIGMAWWRDNGTKERVLAAYNETTTTIGFLESEVATNTWDGSQAANGDTIWYSVIFPVTGWSSNTLMSEDVGNRQIMMRGLKNGDQTIPGTNTLTDVTNYTVKSDTVSGFNATTGVYTIQESGYYSGGADATISCSATATQGLDFRIIGSVYGNIALLSCSSGLTANKASPYSIGFCATYLTKGETVVLKVGSVSQAVTVNTLYCNFYLEKVSSPQQIASSSKQRLRVYATSGTITGGASPDILTTFTNKSIDTDNQWTASTCSMICARSGTLSGNVKIGSSASITYSLNDEIDLYAVKNGTTFSRATVRKTAVTEGSGATHLLAFNNMPVVKGDQIQILFYCDKTYTLGAGASTNEICLTVE